MDRKFDGSFYYEGKKLYYRVVKKCCINSERYECDIEYFSDTNSSIIISKCGNIMKLGVIDPIKAKDFYEEGEQNGK